MQIAGPRIDLDDLLLLQFVRKRQTNTGLTAPPDFDG